MVSTRLILVPTVYFFTIHSKLTVAINLATTLAGKLRGVVIEASRGVVSDISRIVLSSLENFCFKKFICKCTIIFH